ncbi:ClbS/DfsB family four-helix bundle protein [Chloroflexia bacterium SDU3-3]|nr:ClbS/DfsB family four-helix bundle protein [Chloroflexia bacterium SDU3-3]
MARPPAIHPVLYSLSSPMAAICRNESRYIAMTAPESMPDIRARIERAIQRVVRATAPLSPDQLLLPCLPDGWTVKDVLAHLTWWDQWLLATLPADEALDGPRILPPLFDQTSETQDSIDAMNAKVFAHYRSRSVADVLEGFAATRQRVAARVARLSEEDLFAPEGLSKQLGFPAAPLIQGIYEHYEEHADQLERLPFVSR